MRKNKTNKLLLIIVAVALVFSITGCSKSASEDTETEQLALTKENVQKVFGNQYDIRESDLDNEQKSINISFDAKNTIPKNKAKETLKEIENTLNKKFGVNNKSNITINVYVNRNILIESYYGKIQMGEKPVIYIERPNEFTDQTYYMSKKFNLLNPSKDVKVKAKDKEDGDIASKIKLKNPDILTKTGDVQTLIYEVTDSDGNMVTNKEVTINISK